MKKIFVETEGQELGDQKKSKKLRIIDSLKMQPLNKNEKLNAGVNQFIWLDDKKNVLLIHG